MEGERKEGWTAKKEKPRKAKDGRKGSESQMKGEGWKVKDGR